MRQKFFDFATNLKVIKCSNCEVYVAATLPITFHLLLYLAARIFLISSWVERPSFSPEEKEEEGEKKYNHREESLHFKPVACFFCTRCVRSEQVWST